MLALEDMNVHFITGRKGRDFHIVSICTTLGHTVEVVVESFVNVFGGRIVVVKRRGVATSILPFWLTACGTSGEDMHEHGIVIFVIPHELDCALTKIKVFSLGSEELVAEGVEETVACIQVLVTRQTR